MTEEGNPISGAGEALGRQNSFRLCFSPKERELPALLMFSCSLRALSVFQGPSQYLVLFHPTPLLPSSCTRGQQQAEPEISVSV